MRLLLDERLLIPDQRIAPHSRLGIGMAVHYGPIHPFRLTTPELRLQLLLCQRGLGKDHEAGRVEIDPVDDEWTPLAARSEVILDVVVRGHGTRTALERPRRLPGRLVEDDERGVLVQDERIAGCRTWSARGAARAIH